MSASSISKKIVVVEDDDDIRHLYEEILRGEGFDVELARNGKEALALLSRVDRPPCLILTDFMMPEMTGSEMIKILREQDCLMSIPVVMISARPVREIEDVGVEFLKKPIDVDTIVDKVREYCGSPYGPCLPLDEKRKIADGEASPS